jgi:hypothetical protein
VTDEEIKEKKRLRSREYRKNNREKVSAANKQYYKDNKQKEIARVLRWRKDNVEHVSAYNIGEMKRRVATLHDGYVRHLLISNTSIPPDKIPQELIKLKRVELQIKRTLKELSK